jgi:Tfp pilus assembly protein PilN
MLLENPEDFAALRAGMEETFHPVGLMEVGLVDRLASLWWRMERTKVAANQALWESALANLVSPPLPGEESNLILKKQQNKFRVNGAWDQNKQERLLRHEMTLERSFFRLLHELERIQARRQGQDVLPPAVVDVNVNLTED